MLTKMKKAQGLLEYTLLLGAIVAIVIVVLMGQGGLASKVKTTYNTVGSTTTNTVDSASSYGVFNGVSTTDATQAD